MRTYRIHWLALCLGLTILGSAACGRAQADPAVNRSRWTLVTLRDSQHPMADLANSAFSLIFASAVNPVPDGKTSRDALLGGLRTKGQVYGSTGCNEYRASYEISGEMLAIKGLTRTLVDCPGGVPQEIDPSSETLMQQEDRYMAALEKAERYTLSGDRLEIYAAGGQQVLVFRRWP